ncbi:hypothetical protein [Fimbriiglobus ruber]|uniref:Uncharacterized protein n=1 Tax=Fimbriiglobus ruber TaxID=1908690 RepID=A0A225DNN7_9BACT|nr:hypothetical protein [Fimbriiglobus ruber]OWK40188.1 hypothetical protein FRUB_05107 [Fimbriiglobus ruber]
MIRLTCENEVLNVRRVVVRRDLPLAVDSAVRGLADRYGLDLARPDATPRPGDYWLGCSPDDGWGDADASNVGWVSPFDIESGLALLRDQAEGWTLATV